MSWFDVVSCLGHVVGDYSGQVNRRGDIVADSALHTSTPLVHSQHQTYPSEKVSIHHCSVNDIQLQDVQRSE